MKKSIDLSKQILCLLIFLLANQLYAQKTVSGTVTDADSGEPLIGATIIVQKEPTRGTITDIDGNYSIMVSEGEVLVFSYTGVETQSITVGSQSVISPMMSANLLLGEVVVTAFGTQSKEAFSGSADIISSKEIAKRNVTSVISAIEGKATGVQFTSANGQPGSSPNIVIRGVGTLNGSTEPLYIVDGMQFEGALSTINQEDIESLTVLKDASSTALYGSRGANGVILITTKRGSSNGTVVSASASYGVVSRAIPQYEEVTPGQYYESMWQALRNSSAGGGDGQFASENIYDNLGYNPFDVGNTEIVGADGVLNPNANVIYKSLDWYDVLEQSATRKNYNVNVASGGDNHRVYFSTSYLEEEGYVVSSEFDRLTTRVNADFDANDWLTIGGSANVTTSNSAGPSSAGTGSIVNPFGFAKNIGSIYPVYVNDQQGNIVLDAAGENLFDAGEGYSDFNIGSRPVNQGRHALQELILNDERDRNNQYGFRAFSDFHIMDGLTLSLNYGRDLNEGLQKEYENNIIGDAQPTGRYSETRFRRQVENFFQTLTYSKTFQERHNFEILVGHESYDRSFTSNSGLAIDQTATGIFEFDNFATPVSLGGATTDKRIEGYFSKIGYDYDSKYYLTLSARRDGSSVFSPESRWGNFFSVGASWKLDQESFIQDISFINRLKLRGSYGQVGNDDLFDFYLSQPRYALSSNAGSPAILLSDIGNQLLQWETTTSYDVALIFSLFNNFLDGSIEYYKRNTTDLLYDLPIALSNGVNSFPANIGDLYNSGIELGLTANLIRNRGLNWSVTFNASTLKNQITSLPDPVVSGSKRWEEGRSRYDFYILHAAGVDPDNGDQLFFSYEIDEEGNSIPVLDENGEHMTTNDWESTERAYTGANSLPDLIGSVSNNLSYKGISLDFLVTYGLGGDILDNGYSAMMHSGTYGRSLHPDILNAWTQPGDITDVPRQENGNVDLVRTQSTRFLTDASYWAVRNLSVGYTLDNNLSDKIGVNNLRLSLTGENLYLSTKRDGLDPQYNIAGTGAGNDYKPARIISVGLNANF